jgi:hypothetical protein
MSNKLTSCYIRIPFNLTAEDLSQIKSLTLKIRYDDGFIAYLNGTDIARKNFEGTPTGNSYANQQNEDQAAITLENFDISQYINHLKSGDNLLAVHGLNASATSSDFLISLTVISNEGQTDGLNISPDAIQYTTSFKLNQTTQIKVRAVDGNTWSALSEAAFILSTDLTSLIITEIHYHPLAEENVDDREFEFIEMENTGEFPLNLSLARFSKGISFTFPINTILNAGEYIVLASHRTYFKQRYGFPAYSDYDGNLDNGGEKIVLLDALDDTLISSRYNDKSPWPESADGDGYSLVLKNKSTTVDYNDPDNWTSSNEIHGSPEKGIVSGESFIQQIPNDFTLQNNYPNPFNVSTTIPFAVSKPAKIEIKIINLLGQAIETILDKEVLPGSYTVRWDATNQASGIYFYKFKAGDFVDIKKALLLK